MPPPRTLPPRLLAALLAVAARLDAAGVEWLLAGSAGRALQGHARRPHDIDVEVPGRDAAAAGRALGAELRRDRGRGRDSLRARTMVAGVEVDVTCDLVVEGPTHRLEPDFALQRAWSRPIGLAARSIRTAPPEEAVVRALVLGEWAALASAAGAGGADAPPPRAAYVAARLRSAASRPAR
ncbi:nucleotidyltransferase domain-containing protein [Miltoncostaea marina]|uniref:nucleotidyltransferase domain-containing protein n=1 Tax=Miltoncostaea marina TaxID=2843215 RepID=UPI001C3C2074|nr:hypothetical protein [Miltoncostaea marina]